MSLLVSAWQLMSFIPANVISAQASLAVLAVAIGADVSDCSYYGGLTSARLAGPSLLCLGNLIPFPWCKQRLK